MPFRPTLALALVLAFSSGCADGALTDGHTGTVGASMEIQNPGGSSGSSAYDITSSNRRYAASLTVGVAGAWNADLEAITEYVNGADAEAGCVTHSVLTHVYVNGTMVNEVNDYGTNKAHQARAFTSIPLQYRDTVTVDITHIWIPDNPQCGDIALGTRADRTLTAIAEF